MSRPDVLTSVRRAAAGTVGVLASIDGGVVDGMTDEAHPADGVDVPTSGDSEVDAALERLAELDEQPLRAHVSAFDAVHAALQDRLAQAEGQSQ